jgi:lipopolysaccharide export system protein LptC
LSRQQLTWSLLIAAAAFSAWLAWGGPEDKAAPLDAAGKPLPDYYLTGLTLEDYNADGDLSRILRTERLSHISADGTDLEQPRLTLETPQGSPWTITAKQGQLDAAGDTLTLPGAVQITRLATPQNRPLRLNTANLRVRPKQGYAETDEPVTVISNGDRIDAVGFEAWLQGPARIHFRSQVRGHYEP